MGLRKQKLVCITLIDGFHQAQKDLPTQFLLATADLKASILLGSFGTAKPLDRQLFTLSIEQEPASGPVHYQKPLRYGKKEEIRHIFRPEATSPPVVISLFFVLAIAATLPILGGAVSVPVV